MTCDVAEKVVVLFGGINTSHQVMNDTWTFDGKTWTEQDPATRPPARQQAGMAYDSVAHQVILFGGVGGG